MAPNPSDNSPGGKPADDDWLGYGAYADALWSRVVRALDKDNKTGKPLGDDPLVIGIFGEWGAGKSHLLKLVYRRAEDQSARDIAARVMTAADDLTIPLTVTVPVMFQPWKYEHEPHLHVPLAIHVADALEDAWKKLPTDFEHVKVFVERATEGLADAGEKIEAAKGLMVKIGKVWGATKQVVHSNVTKVVAGTVDVAAMSFGVPPLLTGLLSKARDHVAEPEEVSDESDGKDKPKGADKDPKTVKKTATEKRTTSFSHSQDGLAFYRIHKLMQAMTRPKFDTKSLQAAGLEIGKSIEFDLRINFVVFVDDLDRCLPEKAVETLELIKTTFNIESFAFVLALDDEVIERGIGHRYKEYQLVGKKPEMPITGFEYLEKIVHVPFRLPALTPKQAGDFVRQYERDIEPDAALRWFEPIVVPPDSISGEPTQPGSKAMAMPSAAGDPSANRGMQRPDLLELALSGFDAFMPRKLIRMVELMHQIAKIAAIRNTPLQIGSGGVDVRVVLALLLIQLFQPELHRILRRRDESFPVLLAAFATKEDGTKDGARELENERVSDIDLWQWAVNSAHAGQRAAWSPPDFEKTYGYAVQQIGLIHKDDSFERVNAQVVRLPLAAQIVGHRAVNRHVFDVLKLVASLASSLGAEARRLTMRPYFSLLSQTVGTNVTLNIQNATHAHTATTINLQLRFAIRNIDDLAMSLLSADTAVQANLASRNELREAEYIDASSVGSLIQTLQKELSDKANNRVQSDNRKRLNLLNGLKFLAPYLALGDGAGFWKLVQDCVDIAKPTDPKLRALWGDVRSLLNCDDRFNPEKPYIFNTRFTGNTAQYEPIPGFVRIPAGEFQMGSKEDKYNPPRQVTINQPFYISRTLVTVQQYARFMQAGGYKDDNDWWDKQGVDWRTGKFDSQVKEEYYKKWLVQRSIELRQQPMNWADQEKLTSRPVCGVNWFEARAYARWLNAEMRQSITDASIDRAYEIRLPTELQWERAARAKAFTEADTRSWPWGDDETLADQQANLSQTVGSVSAVGLYLPSPIGLYDMAGNAWEWMDNLYQSKPDSMARIAKDKDLKSVESLEKSDLPAQRGGSWDNEPVGARCSSRARPAPDDWDDRTGFRVVLSLAD